MELQTLYVLVCDRVLCTYTRCNDATSALALFISLSDQARVRVEERKEERKKDKKKGENKLKEWREREERKM